MRSMRGLLSGCLTSNVPVFLLVGMKRGVCSQINHFPEDADFDHDGAEYVLRKRLPFIITTTEFIMTKQFCSMNGIQQQQWLCTVKGTVHPKIKNGQIFNPLSPVS